MARKRYSSEQIMGYLREAEILQSKGSTIPQICKKIGVTEQTYQRWRKEGLKVPQKQPKRKRLWLNDGSCIRLRPLFKDHVWSYDFVATRTEDGRALRILTLIDEYTRECLALKVARRLRSQNVLEQLGYLFIYRGLCPDIFVRIMGRNLLQKLLDTGWNDQEFRLCLQNQAAHGRMDTMNRLMESSEMNC